MTFEDWGVLIGLATPALGGIALLFWQMLDLDDD